MMDEYEIASGSEKETLPLPVATPVEESGVAEKVLVATTTYYPEWLELPMPAPGKASFQYFAALPDRAWEITEAVIESTLAQPLHEPSITVLQEAPMLMHEPPLDLPPSPLTTVESVEKYDQLLPTTKLSVRIPNLLGKCKPDLAQFNADSTRSMYLLDGIEPDLSSIWLKSDLEPGGRRTSFREEVKAIHAERTREIVSQQKKTRDPLVFSNWLLHTPEGAKLYDLLCKYQLAAIKKSIDSFKEEMLKITKNEERTYAITSKLCSCSHPDEFDSWLKTQRNGKVLSKSFNIYRLEVIKKEETLQFFRSEVQKNAQNEQQTKEIVERLLESTDPSTFISWIKQYPDGYRLRECFFACQRAAIVEAFEKRFNGCHQSRLGVATQQLLADITQAVRAFFIHPALATSRDVMQRQVNQNDLKANTCIDLITEGDKTIFRVQQFYSVVDLDRDGVEIAFIEAIALIDINADKSDPRKMFGDAQLTARYRGKVDEYGKNVYMTGEEEPWTYV